MHLIVSTYEAHAGFFYSSVIAITAIIGSFLNVVIYRLPIKQRWEFQREAHEVLELPFETPLSNHAQAVRSHCPACGNLIAWYDNIPVLSYLFLKGRCRSCDSSISAQYPFVEGLFIALSWICAWQFGPSIMLLLGVLLTGYLLVMAVIDWHTSYLFDALTLPLMWIGLVASVLVSHISPEKAVLGAALGYLGPWAFTTAYAKLRGLDIALGGGDLKLLAAIGAWCGPIAPFVTLGIGALLFIAWYGVQAIQLRKIDLQALRPLGPFLAIVAWLLFVFPQWHSWIGE